MRGLATKATPGPWAVTDPCGFDASTWVEGAGDGADAHSVAAMNTCTDHPGREQPDAAWIAAMSPAIAGPLAVWLEYEANLYRNVLRPPRQLLDLPSVALARAILGDQP